MRRANYERENGTVAFGGFLDAERPPAPHADLSGAERAEIERQVAPIEDQKLREALENAMRASAEWAKGVQDKKEP